MVDLEGLWRGAYSFESGSDFQAVFWLFLELLRVHAAPDPPDPDDPDLTGRESNLVRRANVPRAANSISDLPILRSPRRVRIGRGDPIRSARPDQNGYRRGRVARSARSHAGPDPGRRRYSDRGGLERIPFHVSKCLPALSKVTRTTRLPFSRADGRLMLAACPADPGRARTGAASRCTSLSSSPVTSIN